MKQSNFFFSFFIIYFLISGCSNFRQISKALQIDSVQRLRRNGSTTLQSLEERTQWISASRDVRRKAKFAHTSFTTVDRVAKRLEQLAAERKERVKELARLRTLEDEAAEVSFYDFIICKLKTDYIDISI